jgi:cytochrome c biogenesis protein
LQAQTDVMMRQRSPWRLLGSFLGSMRLAVSLLVLLAIASIIGTILSQQQPYSNYAVQFGPFWFAVFRTLGLYDVYRTAWYTGIVAFLVLSTATCVTRNTPRMLRDIREFPLRQRENALRAQPHVLEMVSAQDRDALTERLATLLRASGFRPRLLEEGDSQYLAARKGKYHRLGYFLTHIAIIVICAAALYNADIPVKWAELTGSLRPATDFDLPLSKIPASAFMPVHNPAYRGIITLPEGQTADAVFELAGNGYLVQPLPFRIHLKAFHIQYYSTGMPKDFVSDVVLYSPQGKVLKEGAIRVNHPMSYDGVDIYQSSFSDGGSLLTMRSYLLGAADGHSGELQGRVGQTLKAGNSGYSVQLKNFDLYNIVPRSAVGEPRDPRHPTVNLGPSFTYVVHDPQGGGAEMKTYMQPITRDGQGFFVQGYRRSLGDAYQYVYIPTGPAGSIHLFMAYLAALQQAAKEGANASPALFSAVFDRVAARAAPEWTAAQKERFVEASLQTLASLHDYPVPFVLTLSQFDHRWAAGLQVTKWPGTTLIYWGCVALVLGIFILFYLPQQKVWAQIQRRADGSSKLLLGAGTDRNRLDFARQFAGWRAALEAAGAQPISARETHEEVHHGP